MTEDELLTWLRQQVKDSYEASDENRKEACDQHSQEAWAAATFLLGSASAYEQVIKKVRNLKEREYLVARKKGTL